jgi:hypothetical protein
VGTAAENARSSPMPSASARRIALWPPMQLWQRSLAPTSTTRQPFLSP